MRHFLILLASLLAVCSACGQSYVGDSWNSLKTNGRGEISLFYVETPSFVYKDKNQKLTGICVDIVDDFVSWVNQNKNVKLESRFIGNGSNFHAMYDNVKNASGGVIGLGNITITDERKKEVKFSPPIITNFAILVSNSSVPTLAKLEDLPTTFANMTAYTAKGTLNEKRILSLKQTYYPGMKISYTTSSQETLEKIFSDPKGFAYLDLAFYLEALQLQKKIQRHPVGDKMTEKFGFIMPLKNDWEPVINEFFAASGGYLNSEAYRNILIKHLGNTGVKLLNSGTR